MKFPRRTFLHLAAGAAAWPASPTSHGQKPIRRGRHAPPSAFPGARADPETSSQQWPFEPIQNAHDAGARVGREGITLSFDLTDCTLRHPRSGRQLSCVRR